MTALADLRALAEAATPGPWHRHTYGHRDIRQIVRLLGRQLRAGVWPSTDATWVHPDVNDDTDPSVCFVGNGPRQTDNGDFIAACSPDVILRALDVIEAAEDVRRVAIAEHGHDTDAGAPWPSCLPTHMALNRYRDALNALKEALA